VIHNDYTDASAEKRLRDLVDTINVDELLQQRYAIVNVWRTISTPIESSPLALCDARSIASEDLVASERRAADRVGELQLVTWNPQHKWFWYPSLGRHESLLFKTFDSDNKVARRSIHSAFHNPLVPQSAPPRESLESRALLFY
jgi:hypothetical protein